MCYNYKQMGLKSGCALRVWVDTAVSCYLKNKIQLDATYYFIMLM